MKRFMQIAIMTTLCAVMLHGCTGRQPVELITFAPLEYYRVTEEPKILSPWEIDFTVDDFGDKTDDAYIVGEFAGTFSNTATNSSRLIVYVYYIDGIFRFRFLEYGNHRAIHYKNDAMTIQFKVDGETTKVFTLWAYGESNADLRFLYDEDVSTFLSILKEGGEISTVAKIGNSKYNFDIDADDFAKTLNMSNDMHP